MVLYRPRFPGQLGQVACTKLHQAADSSASITRAVLGVR